MKAPCKPKARAGWLHQEFYQTDKEELTLALFKLFQEAEAEETLPKSFYEATVTPIPKPDKDTTKKEKLQNKAVYENTCKMCNKTLANLLQQHTKRITHQLGFIPGSQG